jgi:signal peptidase I
MNEPVVSISQPSSSTVNVKAAPGKRDSIFVKLAIGFGFFMFLALVITRSFLLQPFSFPSESMRPTFNAGTYLFASKWNYGFSYVSLPFSPKLFRGRIFGREAARGDVVVFRHPTQNSDYIKRVIGLPGDRIQMIAGHLNINGAPVKREALPSETITDQSENTLTAKRFRETMPSSGSTVGQAFDVFDLYENGPFDDTLVFIVPSDHYFVMGDNRDNSSDSRADPVSQAGVGFVPAENLIGRILLSSQPRGK